jgi:hypothetical protein
VTWASFDWLPLDVLHIITKALALAALQQMAGGGSSGAAAVGRQQWGGRRGDLFAGRQCR